MLDSCRTSGTEDKTPRAKRHFMMYIYCHKIFCMAVTSRFSQTVCALRLFLTLAANSSLTGFIILHYSQQARSLCHMLSSPAKANHVPVLAANQGWLKPAPFLHAICFERIGDGLRVRCSSASYHTTLLTLSSLNTKTIGKSGILVWLGPGVLLETCTVLELTGYKAGEEPYRSLGPLAVCSAWSVALGMASCTA